MLSSRNLTPGRVFLFLIITGFYTFLTLHFLHSRDCPPMHSNEPQGLPLHPDRTTAQPGVRLGLKPTAPPGKESLQDGLQSVGGVQKKPTAAKNEASDWYHSEADVLPHQQLLSSDFAPNIVHMVWCGRRWFEFHNYINVVSLIKELHPDEIDFYYDSFPIKDDWLYNNWIEEIQAEYPFFRAIQINQKLAGPGCLEHAKPNPDFIRHLLTFYGGLYVNEHTLITKFPMRFRSYDLIDAMEPGTGYGFMMAKRNLPVDTNLQGIKTNKNYKTLNIRCSPHDYDLPKHEPRCVHSDILFFPKDIWELDTAWGRLVRRIFYGSPSIPVPRHDSDELIPNIGHIVWIGGGEMDFLFYLCVLSLLYVQEVDTLYIHGNAPPSGPLWEKVKSNPRLKLIHRYTTMQVYGTDINILSHVTDVWRVDFMIKYGGIYVDTDVIWTKKLDLNIRSYEAVGAYDWTYWNHPFPDTINFGVAIGKRNATYWHKFQKSMSWFVDKDWSWNGLRQPYRIKERHPELVLINPHLQVICYEFKCHPTWWPDYHNESVHHLNSPSIKDWRNDAYAFHMTLPTPYELRSEEELMKSDTIFAQMGKQVLQKAGLLNPQH